MHYPVAMQATWSSGTACSFKIDDASSIIVAVRLQIAGNLKNSKSIFTHPPRSTKSCLNQLIC